MIWVQNLDPLLLGCVKLVNSRNLSLSCFCICKMEIKTEPQQLISLSDIMCECHTYFELSITTEVIKLISF